MLKREEYEEQERTLLAPYGMKSADSEGREFPEKNDPHRTVYQRDRDRIIHSTSFRRLEYKTQVFIYHEGDHYRTRLTHSLEGAQIARSLARILRLNEDLSEAIILAHDLGHTPFGHSGEQVMNQLMKNHGGFEHNRQSLRIVTRLEDRYPEFPGLNLTFEVREGINKHSSPYDHPLPGRLDNYKNPTLEAQLVNVADEIAYCNHDLDDGISSGILTLEQLKEIAIWQEHYELIKMRVLSTGIPSGCVLDERSRGEDPSPPASFKILCRQTVRNIINSYIHDLATETERRIGELKIQTVGDIRKQPKQIVGFSEKFREKNKQLKKFLFENMYRHPRVEERAKETNEVIIFLFHHYLQKPTDLPAPIVELMKTETPERVVCDYIAGMTDRFALAEKTRLSTQ